MLGLIPQAPLHTTSLVVMGYEDASSASSDTAVSSPTPPPETDPLAVQMSDMEDGIPSSRESKSAGAEKRRSSQTSRPKRRKASVTHVERKEVPIAVVEQRVSNLAQGSLCEWEKATSLACADRSQV